ncbi:olfactory receptor 6F1-like [Pyxicephalus adspersus]|uniref:Olfactory receptor n=1 Tax=Pyxicephalus adspersus TaxID=30357 RepID=A0AAV3AB74_PYXAD|nr:TPA: hypothetical protein GDO54_013752 [Pyxicephalus adspersus]
MNTRNESQMAEFVLLGFPSNRELQLLLFFVFLGFYLLTIAANLLIIGTVSIDFNLRKIPMYIFLCHFSFLEIWYITATVPKMLVDFIADNNIISYKGCIAQIYFFFALGFTELFFLVMMGFDRYLAICHPLRYNAIMTRKLCSRMAMWSWICGFSSSLLLTIPSSRFLFCGPTVINHFFCDYIPLLGISCNKTFATDVICYALAWIIILYSFLFTTISYVQIIKTISHLPSLLSRRKAFSTCVSHLTVVLTFYGTIIFMYIRPTTQYSLHIDKFVSVSYAIVIPLLNPIVYTLRNKEIHDALRKIATHGCRII